MICSGIHNESGWWSPTPPSQKIIMLKFKSAPLNGKNLQNNCKNLQNINKMVKNTKIMVKKLKNSTPSAQCS